MSNFIGISKTDLKGVLLIDGKKLSTHPSAYAKANEEVYYLLCNTWLSMCYDAIGLSANRVLLNSILREGLIETISECNRIANDAVSSDFTCCVDSPLRALFSEDERNTLQVLRFAKRFSPLEADILKENSLKAFAKINNQCKGVPQVITESGKVLKRTQQYPRWLINRVSEYCQLLLGEAPTDEEILLNGAFSNGATADGCKTLLSKLQKFREHSCCYKDILYPIGMEVLDDIDYVKAVPVPKNYKTARIIAECSAYSQFHLQGLRKIAEKRVADTTYSHLIVMDDQSINQEWSRLGSVYGTFATIDLSSASDSIATTLAEQILPSGWYNQITKWNAPNIKIGDRKVPRYIFQTSGSGSTFIIESVIFLAISLVATDLVREFSGESIHLPRVFGDDIITDDRVYDTIVDLLGLLRFTVNSDKSFGPGSRYRESCGAEWFCGLDMATKYFPRKSLEKEKPEYLSSVVSLQHRLFSYKEAEIFLSSYIHRISKDYGIERMTSSFPGEECDDLWEDFPYYKVVNPPFDHTKMASAPDGIRREVHVTLKSVSPKDGWANRCSQEDYYLLEMYRYVQFLQHGPQVDEYGISIPPLPYDRDIAIAVSEYGTVIR